MDNHEKITRRNFLSQSAAMSAGILGAGMLAGCQTKMDSAPVSGMKMGLVTYQWGKDWDLPTLIHNCEITGFGAVELRVDHAHKVEPNLTAAERLEVKKRFADSPVVCVGYGSNQEYHSPDTAILQKNIDDTFELIKLCSDIGASGVKVKPNNIPEGVAPEKTIAQIGASLNTVGKYAADYGQIIRVEVHGLISQELPNMRAIFDHVTEPNVYACWNCNNEDLLPPGLEYNFDLIKKRLGDTVHIRELNVGDYPYQELFKLFAGIQYKGWILLEARTEPVDKITAMKEQMVLFNEMLRNV